MKNQKPLLQVDHLEKRFGGRMVLDDVSFGLPRDQILTILGPSGCGKTTLLRVIAGLEKPEQGTVRIQGKKMNGPGFWVPPQERGVAMIFQNLALWPHLNVRGNIGLGLKVRPMDRKQRNGMIDDILDRLRMNTHADRFPHELSVGEQQRVALARSLVLQPRILLLDEPFSHLDWDLRQDLIGLIKGLEATMVFVTHDQLDAFSAGGLMAVMQKGALEQLGTQKDILNRPATPFVRRFVKAPAALLKNLGD